MAVNGTDALSILLVEDNSGDADLIRHELRTGTSTGFAPPDLDHVTSLSAALDRLADAQYDLVLLDLGLQESTGIETLGRLQRRIAETEAIQPPPIVVLTGLSDDETAVAAIEAGAQDYLLKSSLDGDTLERSLRYARERHRQDLELKRQKERLENFASVVSHDLRNPLQVARGRLDHAAETGAEDSFAAIDAALDRMDTIIDEVLRLARDGKTVQERTRVDLGALATESWADVATGDATLSVESTGTLEADATRLRRVFENLFRNAVEHGTGSGPDRGDGVDSGPRSAATGSARGTVEQTPDALSVRVGTLRNGFFVADDGPGIPESEREQVFETGYTTSESGTGFGLNIVEDIVQAHGWRVAVTEGQAGGARFEITDLGSLEADE